MVLYHDFCEEGELESSGYAIVCIQKLISDEVPDHQQLSRLMDLLASAGRGIPLGDRIMIGERIQQLRTQLKTAKQKE